MAKDVGPRIEIEALLALEALDRDLFRSTVNEANANNTLSGAQVMAQALAAACQTVADKPKVPHANSFHGYFMRAGMTDRPVIYQVERARDGGSFSTRRVTALQNGSAIFQMDCSFHTEEEGFSYQLEPAPLNVAGPEGLRSLRQLAETLGDELPDWARKRWLLADYPLEMRPVDPAEFLYAPDRDARRRVWMRMPLRQPQSPAIHSCMMAYMGDYLLATTAAMRHSFPMSGPDFFLASLDHAMWLHRPTRADEWLLVESESPVAHGGRGFARAQIYDVQGTLVASLTQEVLMRRK